MWSPIHKTETLDGTITGTYQVNSPKAFQDSPSLCQNSPIICQNTPASCKVTPSSGMRDIAFCQSSSHLKTPRSEHSSHSFHLQLVSSCSSCSVSYCSRTHSSYHRTPTSCQKSLDSCNMTNSSSQRAHDSCYTPNSCQRTPGSCQRTHNSHHRTPTPCPLPSTSRHSTSTNILRCKSMSRTDLLRAVRRRLVRQEGGPRRNMDNTSSRCPPDGQEGEDRENVPPPVGVNNSPGQNSPIDVTQRHSGTRKHGRRGQLRLHVTCFRNQLTVHVVQARHLRSRRTPLCTSYVEISLVPGDQQTVHHTCTVPGSNQPNFDQKFTLEMREEDEKRLRVAMYNKHSKDTRAELLGCMTFGVKHLTSSSTEDVDGWYYLLNEASGDKKHLQAPSKTRATKTTNLSGTSCSSSGRKSSASIPEVNRSLQGLDTLTVVVRRGRHGYGFTVMGSSPVTIGKVEDGSGAVSAGLRRGDMVVRINGQNVSRSTADSVAKIVKNSPKQIILDVVRSPLTSTTSVQSEGFTAVSQSFASSSNGYESMPSIYEGFQPCPSPASDCSSGSVFSRRTPMSGSTPGSVRRINDTLPLRPSQLDNVSCSGSRSRKSSHSSRDSVNSENNENVMSSRRSGTSSTSSRRSSRKSTKHASPEPASTTAGYDTLRWDATHEEIFFPQQHGEIYDELPWKPFDCDLAKKKSAVKVNEDTYATMQDNDLGEDTYLDVAFTEASSDDDDDESDVTMADYAHTTLPEVSFCDLSRRERARQAAATQLVRAEADFIAQMQYGIQRFSRPLRHCILSAQEHRVLFQNVEKLVAFSEYHMRQMADTSLAYSDLNTTGSEERYVEVVGSVYRQRAAILCEAYELYSQGLGAALQLLSDLTTYEQFHGFLADPAPQGAESTLEEFLRKPEEHLKTLMVTLRTVLSHTSSGHRDASALERVVKAFSACCNKVSAADDTTTTSNNNGRNNSSNNTTSSSTSFTSSRRSGSSSGSKSSTASIDSELVDIQERLVFPEHIPSFQLAIPARHVIYTSELLRVESCMWTKVVVILLSDLLLITRLEGDSLIVVDDPLPLPDVMNSAFGGSHPCEFTLTAEVQSGDDIGWEARHLLLRAPSMEQACTWKSLLEQRIASFRTHRELMTGRSREAVY